MNKVYLVWDYGDLLDVFDSRDKAEALRDRLIAQREVRWKHSGWSKLDLKFDKNIYVVEKIVK